MWTKTKYLGMNGYKESGEPFMSMGDGSLGIECDFRTAMKRVGPSIRR